MECGCLAWNMMLLSASLSAGGDCPPEIRLSLIDSMDQEWTGLILGAEDETEIRIRITVNGGFY